MHEKHFGTFFFFADTHIHQKFISKSQGLAELALYMKIEYQPPPICSLSLSHSLYLFPFLFAGQQKKRETIYALADVRLNKLPSAHNGKLMNYDPCTLPQPPYAKAPGWENYRSIQMTGEFMSRVSVESLPRPLLRAINKFPVTTLACYIE